MSLPLILACVWALVATITAMLPMRLQMWPGLSLLVCAPILILWIGAVHGWLWVVVLLVAFGSVMRNPLRYFLARARGERPTIPREMQR